MFLTNALIGLLPFERMRRALYDYVALVAFRILSRSFSAVLTFHNEQFRPKSDGICVANHTTPIDVVFLSCDQTYALVKKNMPRSGEEKGREEAGGRAGEKGVRFQESSSSSF